MPFEIPTASFDASEHARNKAIRANQLEASILQQYKDSFEDFWGVSGSDVTTDVDGVSVTAFVSNGSRYSVQEMQQVIDTLGAAAIQILTGAAGLTQFIDAAYPGVLPDRYKTAAFTYTIGQNGLVIGNLNEFWNVTV